MLVDTHCHLNFDSFDGDRDEVMARARKVGLVRLMNPGIDIASSRSANALADVYGEVYTAVGVHPNSARSWNSGTLSELRELVKHPKVVALGEIGLDYYRDHAPHALQRRVFRHQLELAAEVELPVVLHTRNASQTDHKATSDVLDILAEWRGSTLFPKSILASRPGVFHSYGGDLDSALKAVELGFWIGVTGPVTFRNAHELRQVILSLPMDYLLIETDAPFLTPDPYRGQRNEPAYVRFVAEKIAQLHNLSYEIVNQQTAKNAERLFDW